MRLAALAAGVLLVAGLTGARSQRQQETSPPRQREAVPSTKDERLPEGTGPEQRSPGRGVVQGRVVDRAGAPLAGLALEIALEGLVDPDPDSARDLNSAIARRRLQREARERGEGRPRDHVFTDGEGRFRSSGLIDARYEVWATPEDRQDLLTPQPVQADGRELLLVYERPHLVVRVLDEHGVPWPRIETLDVIYGRELRLHHASPTLVDEWPARPGVRLEPLDQLVGSREEIAPEPGTPVGDALVLELVAGRRYRVGLFGGEQPWRPIEIEAGSGATQVELRAVPARPTGTLVVTAHDEVGPIEDRVEIRVEDPVDGFLLLRGFAWRKESWPRTLSIPEGSWRVVVDGLPMTSQDHDLIEKSAHGRFETRVDVRGGETMAIDAVLPSGGLLELTVTGTPPVGIPLGSHWWEVERHGVCVTLRAPGRWPLRLDFESPRPDERFPALNSRLPLNTTATSERLPAGRWTLVGELPDGRVQRTEIVLVDGETTSARLEFGAPPPAPVEAPVR